jgi:hypothetical protein
MPIRVAGVAFSSQAKLKVHLSHILDDVLEDTRDLARSHPDAFPFVWGVLSRHPDADTRLVNVDRVILAMSTTGTYLRRTAFIQYLDGSIEDISLRNKCITGRNPDPKRRLHAAMRSAVASQVSAFRRVSSGVCDMCGTRGTENLMHIDHAGPSLYGLADAFVDMMEAEQTRTPVTFEQGGQFSSHFGFTPEDSGYECAWSEYHREHANLRMLCLRCNCGHNRKCGVNKKQHMFSDE